MSKPSMIPFLQYAENRALSEKIYRGYFMRGDNGNANDNNAIGCQNGKPACKKGHFWVLSLMQIMLLMKIWPRHPVMFMIF